MIKVRNKAKEEIFTAEVSCDTIIFSPKEVSPQDAVGLPSGFGHTGCSTTIFQTNFLETIQSTPRIVLQKHGPPRRTTRAEVYADFNKVEKYKLYVLGMPRYGLQSSSGAQLE